ncbi:glycosyltransferase [Mariprofundus erugo]|uniref:Glycosyltransferase n=1 Tax=Mariprofundus erugo TaxID=2528639 RepID=A0A5R9GW75_9PROT|nr:galactosyltransferase-related protein [Mariprofundus erugo]TLS67334.1 glycosyltransferase [Mariprofundus erugo]
MPVSPLAVVISTYNAPDFLRLTLEGYRQQSDKAFVIYIADDGSTDETKILIERLRRNFPVPIHHIWQPDDGFRKARIHNRVIARIDEPYTLLTDGDCIPLPELVAAHRRFATDHIFISGSRVLLSATWTATLCAQSAALTTDRPTIWWLQQRFKGHINRVMPLLLPAALSPASTRLEGIRGCHLSCPTAALRQINGFDESFEGWGREDSDLTARLLHAGLKRRNLRGQPVLHLWHREFSRQQLTENDALLQACLDEKRVEALCGLKQLEESHG